MAEVELKLNDGKAMIEVEATIRVLDRLRNPLFTAWEGWWIDLQGCSIGIDYRNGKFHTVGFETTSGFELLEHLADLSPRIARKLAEPMEI